MPWRLPLLAAFVALAAPPAVAQSDAAKPELCAACHGEAGISDKEGIPSLAGQPDYFVQWQLVFFRSGTRKNELMSPVAAPLSDEDVRALGAYFAALPPPKPADAADDRPELSEAGAALAKRNRCATCHGEKLAGLQAAARLAGQREDYLLKALRDFKSGARTGTGVAAMPEVTYPLSDDDMTALAHYIARLR
jgi:cytochrome c553